MRKHANKSSSMATIPYISFRSYSVTLVQDTAFEYLESQLSGNPMEVLCKRCKDNASLIGSDHYTAECGGKG